MRWLSHRSVSTNAAHIDGANVKSGPVACLESRTSTRSGIEATSRHPLLSFPPLAVLLRQTGLGVATGAGNSVLCSTMAPFGLNQPRMSRFRVTVISKLA